ncbi:MarR family winged helix-turn-helix transcriptional regulator [Thermostaphylospora chromogena]|uniref:DNA-binding transcriptional regulator, MarR family n=1 Tax=Thermostaphylospora chromogena TaxID=35622 RepID=A0A1H1BGB3_9ACTN|nr:MarR family transcriptional regulator [Thermostaphylospora chromogena]SDQ50952.1 DNA-binding transcriptional regulator, MarR family [Thermostaphylospora chromogena]
MTIRPEEDAERIRAGLGRELGGRLGTGVVLFHSAIAERLGINVTDWRCLEILLRTGPANPTRLAQHTGMSSAAIAQILGRLERAGLIVRRPDPSDGRRTLVHPISDPERDRELSEAFAGLARRVADLTSSFSEDQLAAIAAFMTGLADIMESEAAALRRGRPTGR